jgi:hypothetical protein
MMSDAAEAAIACIRVGLSALDDHKSQPERSLIYSALAAHIRNASPMSLVSLPDLVPSDDALIDLGAGALVRLRVLDGKLNMYVCESTARDVAVVVGDTAREQLRAALAVVR